MSNTQLPIDGAAMEDAVNPEDVTDSDERDPQGIARYPEACRIVGLCPQSIRNRTKKTSPYFDPTFPEKRPLSNRPNGAVGFLRGSLYAWATSRHEGNQ